MMYIMLRNAEREPRGECVWYIGQEVPVEQEDMDLVVEVQADGDELEFITKNFTNFPVAKNRSVVRYFGDMARFIASNIK